ncbi:MAG: efflux RND transporter permease subunit [Myxococcota bacterium]|nr:efflux RND transporter permease subunit [Myxococcota bacterium]
MNRSIAWFAENHVAANLVLLVIVLAGLLTLPTLTQEFIPDIELDTITVSVAYPGASPEEVEKSITNRVEEEIHGLAGIKRVRSVSAEGLATVTAELLAGEDVRHRLDDVRAAVDRIDTFPEDAEEPTVQQLEIRNRVLNLAVAGDVDGWTLKRVAQQVRDEIVALPGVTDAELRLDRPYEISIEVSEAALRQFGLSFDDVTRAVRQSSLDLPGGTVKTEGGEILLRAKGQAYDHRDFEAISLVSRRDGTRLTLGDVATVIDGFAESDQSARFDGVPSLLVEVSRSGDQKSLAIAEAVHVYVAEAQARLPAGIALTIWQDDSQILRDRLDTMLRNARGGFVLVVAILALFLRLRLAFWVSLGIPLSFLGAITLLPSLDVTINFVSLVGFIVVLGIVVDDAIVVGENTHTWQQRTGEKLRGAILGAQTIVVPVIFGVLTTVAAFTPLLALPGPMGRMSRAVPLVVIACLVFSVLEAMWILPAHLGHGSAPLDAAPSNPISRGWRTMQDRIAAALEDLIERGYRPLLRRALEWRLLTVAIALGLLLVTVGVLAGGWLRFLFITPVEADVISARLTMAQGTPAHVTAAAIDGLEDAALAVRAEVDATTPPDAPSVFTHVLAIVGEQPSRDFEGPAPGLGGGHLSAGNEGEVQVEVVSFKQRDVEVAELASRWRERVGAIPGAVELVFQSSLVTSGAPIEIELSGPELGRLRAGAAAVKQLLAGYPGVFDITDSFRGGKQELEYQILPAGEALGITMADLARQLRQGFYGEEAQSVQRGRDEVKVMVRYPAAQRRALEDVEQVRIRSADGGEVPFASVARARLGTGFSTIRHVDRRRVVSVTADVDIAVANANQIVADLKRGALERALASYHGVQYSFEGEQAEQRDFLSAMGRGYAVALLVIFTLLAVPLRSYVQPLVIMSAIPFGLVGAAWGHVLLGLDFTMYSILGLVALSGVVVNASLVLVDAANQRRAEGADVEHAVTEAAVSRFRAILLTSLTTFAGLTPLMLETSMQARFMIPMAVSIAFGVVFASFITLFLVPASSLLLDDVGAWLGRSRAPAPLPEPVRGGR